MCSFLAQRKLKNIVMKAESMGTSLAEVFGVFDKDGSGVITAAELEEGLRELRVFDSIPKDQVQVVSSIVGGRQPTLTTVELFQECLSQCGGDRLYVRER